MTPTTAISPEKILQLGSAFWASKTLLSAVELGIFTKFAESGPLEVAQVRDALGLHERSAHDFLDALVALGMLQRDPDGRYTNTPETDLYLDRNKPSYVGGMLEMMNGRLYRFWGNLTEALRTGLPQNEIRHGEPDLFAAIYAEPARLELFLSAMTGLSLPTARAIANAFPWAEYRTFADVGCAQGGLTVEIARAHPHLTGYGFDLPAVQPVFERYVAQQGLDRRLTFQAGDFFKDPLPGVDVLVMGHILHDWSLEEKKLLLQKAHEALPKGGALIAYDAMIDDGRRENAFGLLMSLNMLIETPAGFDYTGVDCRNWMEEAGFQDVQIRPLQSPYSAAIGRK
ncbi:methyltransferase [Microvirga sp. VF16]|uniref:methyltransferase n=1 Tax=Microvirga sp. VF16 TaxID=2807101 RepID=UPI00193DF321|nr:methyltransferase [Microvirga sp. VF16]QRM30363.1 methyltransferase domain-containing protein [Microvirga sp. VF16]